MEENLDVFFKDMAVPVVWGAEIFNGILDLPDEGLAGGSVLSTEYNLRVPSQSIIGMKDGAVISIDGEEYEVRYIRKEFDGKTSLLILSKT